MTAKIRESRSLQLLISLLAGLAATAWFWAMGHPEAAVPAFIVAALAWETSRGRACRVPLLRGRR